MAQNLDDIEKKLLGRNLTNDPKKDKAYEMYQYLKKIIVSNKDLKSGLTMFGIFAASVVLFFSVFLIIKPGQHSVNSFCIEGLFLSLVTIALLIGYIIKLKKPTDTEKAIDELYRIIVNGSPSDKERAYGILSQYYRKCVALEQENNKKAALLALYDIANNQK